MSDRESTVEKYLVKYAAENGIVVEKLTGRNGWPDRTLFDSNGRTAYAECKRPRGGKYSKLQIETLAWLRRRGFKAEFVKTKDDARRFVDSMIATSLDFEFEL